MRLEYGINPSQEAKQDGQPVRVLRWYKVRKG